MSTPALHPDELVPDPDMLADGWAPQDGATYKARTGEPTVQGLIAVVWKLACTFAFRAGFNAGRDTGFATGHAEGLVTGRAEGVKAQRSIEQGAEAAHRRASEMLARFAYAGPELEDRIREVLTRLDGGVAREDVAVAKHEPPESAADAARWVRLRELLAAANASVAEPEDVLRVLDGGRDVIRQREYEVAKRYYGLLEQVPKVGDEELAKIKDELDELLAPYSDNQAFVVFLELKRAAAMAKRKTVTTEVAALEGEFGDGKVADD